METKTGNIKFHLFNVSETNDADLNCVFFFFGSVWCSDVPAIRVF